MPDIDIKAQALSEARTRIVRLQKQMTDRVLKMAAEVEKLMETVSPAEAREFLKVSCNLPAVELSTYVGFAKTLKGSEDLLTHVRVSFPVVKALVSASADTREEVLARMAIGAQIDTKDISAIRKRLHEARLSPAEVMAARNRKLVAAAARKRSSASVAAFEERMLAFVGSVRTIAGNPKAETEVVRDSIRHEASELLKEFGSLFGAEHRALSDVKANSPAFRIAAAHHSLKRFADRLFGKGFGYGFEDRSTSHEAVEALQALTGKALPRPGWVRGRTGISELPPRRYRLGVIELCAGAGGMAIGLERAGFEHVALIEFDKHAAATLRKNRPHWNVIENDLRKIDFHPYRKDDLALLVGGLPCQPYSADGNGLGKKDPRDLLLEGVRAVKEARPKAFLFENVEGLLHAKHADHLADVLQKLSRAGYQVAIHRMNTEDYGIAQERGRILIVGLRRELAGAFRMPPRFPEWRMNIGDALADLMAANGWSGAGEWVRQRREQAVIGKDGTLAYGVLASTIVARKGKARDKERQRWANKGISIAGIPKAAPTDADAQADGFLPGLTLRMRARLQDFPDDWAFVGSDQKVSEQIGNAVACRMAQAVGLAMFSTMRGVEFDWEAMIRAPQRSRPFVEAPTLVPGEEIEKLMAQT